MSKALLHTPVGVRDVYGKECAVKLTIENNINKVFNLYGYHNIQTPTFEFFDILIKKEVLLLQRICISSLTEKVIHWF